MKRPALYTDFQKYGNPFQANRNVILTNALIVQAFKMQLQLCRQ